MINFITKIPFTISDEYRQKYIADIEDLIANDNWRKDKPVYQTWPTLFDRKEIYWIELYDRIRSIISFIDPNIKNLICWSYVSFIGYKGSMGRGWHGHKSDNSVLSIIYYLQLEDINNGTMFDLGDMIVIPKVDVNYLYVYDPSLLHAPTYWDYEKATKNRIVLSIIAFK